MPISYDRAVSILERLRTRYPNTEEWINELTHCENISAMFDSGEARRALLDARAAAAAQLENERRAAAEREAARIARIRAIPGTGRYIVSVYLEDMAYGGGEEGGWWYNTAQLARSIRRFRTHRAAADYAARLNNKLDSRLWGPNEGRREVSSVLSEGVYVARVNRDTPPEFTPERRPRYE